jgi:hypothetical protein
MFRPQWPSSDNNLPIMRLGLHDFILSVRLNYDSCVYYFRIGSNLTRVLPLWPKRLVELHISTWFSKVATIKVKRN